jgi:hypothetical protein
MTTEQTPTTVPAPQEQKQAEKPAKAAATPKQNKATSPETTGQESKPAKAESKPHPKSAK